MKSHWENVYATRETDNVGWYEAEPRVCIELFNECRLVAEDLIIDAGAGATTFIDWLVDSGFHNIVATDISRTALEKLKQRLGPERAANVSCIVADVTQPDALSNVTGAALWHDRALLHFLLEENQRQAYLSLVKRVLAPGGQVMIAAFSTEGAKMCSGLNIRQYDEEMLKEFLGDEFTLFKSRRHIHKTPAGDPRPYVYTLFKRNG